MSDAALWVGLAGALGGAAITAVGGVAVANRQRRAARESEAAALARQHAERDVARHQQDVRAEVDRLTGLRVGGRLWMDVLLRFQQTLRAGHPADLAAFDAAVADAGGQVVQLGYARLYHREHEVERCSARVHDHLVALTTATRQLVLDFDLGIRDEVWDRLDEQMAGLAQTRLELVRAMDAHAIRLLHGEDPAGNATAPPGGAAPPPTWPPRGGGG